MLGLRPQSFHSAHVFIYIFFSFVRSFVVLLWLHYDFFSFFPLLRLLISICSDRYNIWCVSAQFTTFPKRLQNCTSKWYIRRALSLDLSVLWLLLVWHKCIEAQHLLRNMWMECTFFLLHSVSSEWVYGSNRSVWENRCQAESWNLSSWHYYLWNWTKTTHCSLLSRNLFYSLGRRIDGESGRVHGGKAKTTNASWRWLEWCERPKAIKIYGWKILQNHCTFSRCHSEVVFYYFWRSSVVVVLLWLIKLLRQIDFNFFQLQPQLRTDQQKNMRNCNVKSQFAWPHRTQMVMVGHF